MSETLHKTEPESTGYLLHASTCRQRLKNSKAEPEWGKAAQWMPRASKVRNDSEQQEGIGGRQEKSTTTAAATQLYTLFKIWQIAVKNQQKLLHANHTSIKLICFSRACTRQQERENVASCPIWPIPLMSWTITPPAYPCTHSLKLYVPHFRRGLLLETVFKWDV